MRTLDRYIARQFLFNALMLFVVVSGLYMLLDLIINFDEFASATQGLESVGFVERATITLGRAWSFYWPRLFLLYTYVAGLLPIGAAGFTFAHLVRNRELVGILAGGVSLRRLTVPILLLTVAFNALLWVDQELVLPTLTHELIDGRYKLKKGRAKLIGLRFAPDGSGALFTTSGFDPENQSMEKVTILPRREVRPGVHDRATTRITAAQAFWDAERGGWSLVNAHAVHEPEDATDPGAPLQRRVEAIDFIASDLDPPTILLRERERYRQLLSTPQLAALIGKPELVDTHELMRILHSRYALLVVNVLIVLMGVPVFMLRNPGPMLLPTIRAAALCVPAWAGGFVMHQLSPDALPPAAIAWLPVALYLPIAWYMMESVET